MVTTPSSKDLWPLLTASEFSDSDKTDPFVNDLKEKGVAVIRNVISPEDAETWKSTLDQYLDHNPHTKISLAESRDLYEIELFWSLAQLNTRSHPNILAAQKFLMTECWHHPAEANTRISTRYPVTYADRLRITLPKPNPDESERSPPCAPVHPRVDGGSVERWEADGYGGKTGTYRAVWSGAWEDYDPWDGTARLNVNSDLYNGECACSVFRMFQGMVSLSVGSTGEEETASMRICGLPLRLATAYWLLRPLFSPKQSKDAGAEAFLDASNWTLEPTQSPILHGASPCHWQELNAVLHPHLQLDKTLLSLPPLNPGDYVVWHPDMIYSTCTPTTASRATSPKNPQLYGYPPPPRRHHSRPSTPAPTSTLLYIPACPLTQTNALFLARQRKAFLLGFPGPDFTFTHVGPDIGESYHMDRPGVQEINDAGGEEALRAMGLLAWDIDGEDGGEHEGEERLLQIANAILFPG